MIKSLKFTNLNGIAFAGTIALIAYFSHHFSQWLDPVVWALLLGILLGNALQIPKSTLPGIQYSEKKILGWAIALMGLQLSGDTLAQLDWTILLALVFILVLTILLSRYIGPFLGLNKTASILIGSGNAICGASAVAAVASVKHASPDDTGTGVAVVNLLGTLGMFILPALALSIQLSPTEGGVLTGGLLQAVGQAVAAGYSLGDSAGEIATAVKMSRVFMLLPVLVFFSLQGGDAKKVSLKILPNYLWIFLGLVILTNIIELPNDWLKTGKIIEKGLLAIAMAAIGLRINFKTLLKQGPKALLLGVLLFIIQTVVLLGFIFLNRPA